MQGIIDAKLKKIIIKNLSMSISESDIEDDANIVKVFGLDSLQLVKIVTEIEEELGATFSDEDTMYEAFSSYRKLLDYIVKNAQ
jgi:acyl carrier protein